MWRSGDGEREWGASAAGALGSGWGRGHVAEKIREVRETRSSNLTLPLPNLTVLVRVCDVQFG